MSKAVGQTRRAATTTTAEGAFGEVLELIQAARQRVARAANAEVIGLYWRIGQYLHGRIEADGWAKETVEQLAACIARCKSSRRSFSARNLWRMRQFFRAYPLGSQLSTLLREVAWSSHLNILSRAKRKEERDFYLRMTAQQGWQVREVATHHPVPSQNHRGFGESRTTIATPHSHVADLRPVMDALQCDWGCWSATLRGDGSRSMLHSRGPTR